MGVLPLQADIVGATWTSATAGSLNGDSFMISGATATSFTTDLSGANFQPYALSSSQKALGLVQGTYTITFSSPVTNLLFYDIFYRGATYDFDSPSTIVAGDANVTYSGDNITTPGSFSTYANGVVEFSGPLSSLTFTDGSTGSVGADFGVDTSSATPEPGTFGLISLAAAAAFLLRRHSSRIS